VNYIKKTHGTDKADIKMRERHLKAHKNKK
jgi:hypothetical protein